MRSFFRLYHSLRTELGTIFALPSRKAIGYNQAMAEENGLSEREQDILRLVATGASNKEIAQALVISPNTVKVHLRNIFAKIGVASRTEATLYALRTGLIESPAPPAEAAEQAPVPIAEPDALPAEGNTALPLARRLRWAGLIAAILVAAFALVLIGGRALGLSLFITPTPQITPSASQVPVELERWQIDPALPQAVGFAASAVYEQTLYLIGGQTDAGAGNGVFAYDTNQENWTAQKSKPTAVRDIQAALIGEMIYVPGGLSAAGEPTAAVERFDPRGNTWETTAPLPAPRSAYALAALEGRLYLFGGWDGRAFQKTLFIYDPSENRWTRGADLPFACGFASAVSSNGKIFLLGGTSDGKTATTAALAYYPQRDQDGEDPWETQADIPQARFAGSAATLGDLVFLFGGSDGSNAENLPGMQYQPQRDEWSVLSDSQQPLGPGVSAVGIENFIHVLGPGTTHQRYQAIYTITIPVITR